MSLFVYDTGALIAAERGSKRMRLFHQEAMDSEIAPLVLGPVITQAWRGGPRATRIARMVSDCKVLDGLKLDEYYAMGVALPKVQLVKKKKIDIIDMMVAMTARIFHASAIATSDGDDIRAYLAALEFDCEVIHV